MSNNLYWEKSKIYCKWEESDQNAWELLLMHTKIKLENTQVKSWYEKVSGMMTDIDRYGNIDLSPARNFIRNEKQWRIIMHGPQYFTETRNAKIETCCTMKTNQCYRIWMAPLAPSRRNSEPLYQAASQCEYVPIRGSSVTGTTRPPYDRSTMLVS